MEYKLIAVKKLPESDVRRPYTPSILTAFTNSKAKYCRVVMDGVKNHSLFGQIRGTMIRDKKHKKNRYSGIKTKMINGEVYLIKEEK